MSTLTANTLTVTATDPVVPAFVSTFNGLGHCSLLSSPFWGRPVVCLPFPAWRWIDPKSGIAWTLEQTDEQKASRRREYVMGTEPLAEFHRRHPGEHRLGLPDPAHTKFSFCVKYYPRWNNPVKYIVATSHGDGFFGRFFYRVDRGVLTHSVCDCLHGQYRCPDTAELSRMRDEAEGNLPQGYLKHFAGSLSDVA